MAWNYPTPAALARYLVEQSLQPAAANDEPTTAPPAAPASPADDAHLAALLSEIENLSDEEVKRLLTDEERH